MLTMENIFSEIIENGGSTPCRKVNEIASRFPERVAFRDKRFGIWSEISYQSFWDQAQWVGCALNYFGCLLYTSPSPRDGLLSRMPSSA